ncbi:MAG: type I methionyl aminopeptidase, partial [Pseudomonadota bacterium]
MTYSPAFEKPDGLGQPGPQTAGRPAGPSGSVTRAADFSGMRAAGRLAAECLDMLTPHVQPGITTNQLDALAYEFVLSHGGVPACLGYRGYTKTICTSINHVVCHGIPAAKALRDGDIVNIDVTVVVDGWHGDTSRMYMVGAPRVKAKRLVDLTFEAMWKGIDAVRPGATTGDIGAAIQTYVEAAGSSVVRDFCGHGLGLAFHS